MLTGRGWEAENRPIREARGVAPTVTCTRLPDAMDGRATLEFADRIEPVRALINSVGAGGESKLNRLVLAEGRGPVIDKASEVTASSMRA